MSSDIRCRSCRMRCFDIVQLQQKSYRTSPRERHVGPTIRSGAPIVDTMLFTRLRRQRCVLSGNVTVSDLNFREKKTGKIWGRRITLTREDYLVNRRQRSGPEGGWRMQYIGHGGEGLALYPASRIHTHTHTNTCRSVVQREAGIVLFVSSPPEHLISGHSLWPRNA